jgi:hypothetical protein
MPISIPTEISVTLPISLVSWLVGTDDNGGKDYEQLYKQLDGLSNSHIRICLYNNQTLPKILRIGQFIIKWGFTLLLISSVQRMFSFQFQV